MSIVKIKSITNKQNLIGMFCCTDSIIMDRPVGNPAMITKVSGQRVYFKFLPRRWIPEEDTHVYQENFDPAEIEEKHCLSKSILYVCTSAKEAIAMADEARIVAEKIREFSKEITLQFHAAIASGKLNVS